MFRDFKYLIAYLGPLSLYFSLMKGSWWSFFTVGFLFILLPCIELVAKGTKENLSADEELTQSSKWFFDLMLYLNLPILMGLLVLYFNQISYAELQVFEKVGMTLSMGVIIGSVGINVAHELGHRNSFFELFIAKSLLMTAFYIHFNIEHNRGHHKFVATEEDPSSARFNESIYAFWIRSICGVYVKAWDLEHKRLDSSKLSRWSFHNEMIRIHFIQFTYILLVAWWWSWSIVIYAGLAALIGVLLLESVNYIEHYGLRRKKKENGRYEIVGPHHSWNSNNDLGRIFLYELTRHSDHHFKATRKYQTLRHFDESPQLPTGYPGSIILSLVPPLWYKTMNQRVINFNKQEIGYQ